MLKGEFVYREIAESKGLLTQLAISKILGLSLSTVNGAIRPLVSMGAISVLHRGLKVRDMEKLLLYWGSQRDIESDIVYATRVDASPSQIEKGMPASVVYTAYSAFKFRFGSVPADYSEIYVYGDAEEIKRRFPPQKGPPNLFVLKPDQRLSELSKSNIAPLSQVFVDLWNLREWYAKEFLKALKERLI